MVLVIQLGLVNLIESTPSLASYFSYNFLTDSVTYLYVKYFDKNQRTVSKSPKSYYPIGLKFSQHHSHVFLQRMYRLYQIEENKPKQRTQNQIILVLGGFSI